MKQLVAVASLLAFACSAAMAAEASKADKAVKAEAPIMLETAVKPAVTQLRVMNPQTGLYVGNSFTYYNCGVNGYVRGLTKETKDPAVKAWIARMITISAGRLAQHDIDSYLKPEKAGSYARAGKPKFDVVFLQGQSREPYEKADAYKKSLKAAIEKVRAAGGEPIVVDTWAMRGKPEQTKQLADATIAAANENQAVCLPVGLAFAESLKQRPDLVLHAADGRHPSAAGSYLYGAMAYSLLFKRSPEKLYFNGGCDKPISNVDAKFLQKLAWKVTSQFYGWH